MTSQRLTSWESEIRSRVPAFGAVLCVDSVGSTMDLARDLELPSANPSGIVVAQRQFAGRGRQGRAWEQAGTGLYSTYVFQAEVAASALVGFSLAVGCALRRTISRLGADIKLKWPNDLVTDDGSKLGGVLIELVTTEQLLRVLVGIGVNISSAPDVQADRGSAAVALDSISSQQLHVIDLACAIGLELADLWPIFLKSGLAKFSEEWTRAAFGLGGPITLDTGQTRVSGTYVGINQQGCVLINVQGSVSAFASGHVLLMKDCRG